MPVPLIFDLSKPGRVGHSLPACAAPTKPTESLIPAKFLRSAPPRLPEVSEGETVRHFVNLSALNHHIDRGMYPLGSCTMKYNPKVNEVAARLPGFAEMHPLAPSQTTQGLLRLIHELERMLCEITGFAGVTLQPPAGAASELTGLLVMRQYHRQKGNRKTHVLLPDSAHGTNPASATFAGYEARQLASTDDGRLSLDALRAAVNDETAGLMITNPSTLGLFETHIREIAGIIHGVDGLVYMDGANMNALLGIAKPAAMGVDICHLNLHKTFSTPHGGGGPGGGCLAVREDLVPFLPVPRVEITDGDYRFTWDRPESIGNVHAFWGNVGVMVRAYCYIRMMGGDGLERVSRTAIINANYLYALVKDLFDTPYQGPYMHEFVVSGDRQKARGVRTLDMAKRLLDFGVYAPTVYFPLIVSEAMMIEPTETESKQAIEEYAALLRQIAREVEEEPETVLKAPHATPIGRVDEVRAARQPDLRYAYDGL
ncbi:MAG TPA: aminomethyl-transferring glycine dehydrogenase subunit GcvPB [Candidatus Latescibacteria bacterium]|nr:aminomethyl-transferring glycine dehydrogenase subunit GcvPB [Candidatus Latescibacterota bacterium]